MEITNQKRIEILSKFSTVLEKALNIYQSIFNSLSIKIKNEELEGDSRFLKIILSKSIDYTGLYSLFFFDIEREIVVCCLIHDDSDFSFDKLSRIVDSSFGKETPNGIIRNIDYYTDSTSLYDLKNLSGEKILFYKAYDFALLSSNDFSEKFTYDCNNLLELYSAILKSKKGENVK